MNNFFLLFFLYFGIFTNAQSKSDSGNYPPAPGYNKSYPSPYDKKKTSDPVAPPEAIVGKMDLKDVFTQADQPAEFPGSYNGFRKKIIENFNRKGYDGTEKPFSAMIYLIIDQKGLISDIYIAGPENHFNQSLKEAIKKIDTPWKPAVHEQKEVKFLMQIPLKLYFD